MKRILTLSLALAFVATSFAAGTSIVVPKKSPNPNANEILVPIGKNGEKISLMDLSVMKVKDYETLTGKKMNVADKVGFKIIQKKLRSSINSKGEINKKMLEKAATKLKKADDRQYLRLWLILLAVAVGLSIIGIFVPFLWWIAWLAGLGAAIFFVLWLVSKASTM
jgi:hypothetical protein